MIPDIRLDKAVTLWTSSRGKLEQSQQDDNVRSNVLQRWQCTTGGIMVRCREDGTDAAGQGCGSECFRWMV
jgi:hypothetical protein